MDNTLKAPPPSSASLAVLFLRLAFAALARAFISPFKGSNGAPTYFKDVMYAMIRKQLQITTISQTRHLNKPTSECYADWTKSKKLAPVTEELENEAKAHWLGDKTADRVIVYFHGGGYRQPLQPAYFDYLADLREQLNTAETSFAVVVLAYTLAPEATYPTQLIQAATLFNHVLRTHEPSSLTLMGDSAGGNLAIAILSHILHPHPDIRVPRIKLSEPLKGLVAMSPWVSFTAELPSYQRNAETDMIGSSELKRWSDIFIGKGNIHDEYSEPVRCGSSWWKEASQSVSSVLIWGGEQEVLVDSIKTLGDDFSTGWTSGGSERNKVAVVITPKHAHVEPLVDVMLQYKTKGEGAVAVENWLKSQK